MLFTTRSLFRHPDWGRDESHWGKLGFVPVCLIVLRPKHLLVVKCNVVNREEAVKVVLHLVSELEDCDQNCMETCPIHAIEHLCSGRRRGLYE